MDTAVFNRNKAIDNIMSHRICTWEFFDFFIGDLLGSGSSRYVFEYKVDPRYVVKIDCSDTNANVSEWQVWMRVAYVEKVARWFAPCKQISNCGRILLQRKCKTDISYDEYPKQVPAFFTDLKYQNWGKLNGKMVCFDYASHLMLENGMALNLRKTNWWQLQA